MAEHPVRGAPNERALTQASPTAQREIARVADILRQAQGSAQTRDAKLKNALDAVQRSSAELSNARSELAERTDELRTLRAEYYNDLRERGERAAELTRDFLQQEFAAQLQDMQSMLTASFEQREQKLRASAMDSERAVEQAMRQIEGLQAEVVAAKEQAASDLARLREAHRTEQEELREQIVCIRQEAQEQHRTRIEQLEAAVRERDGLFEASNQLVETLQQEVARVRHASTAEIAELAERHARETSELVDKQQALEDRCEAAEARNNQLENIIDCQVHLRSAKELEEERDQLRMNEEQRQQQLEQVMQSLRVLRDACNASPAARSILAGTQRGLDLSTLFSVLDR